MKNKMYDGNIKEQHEKFYEAISWFSHPNVRSTVSDFNSIMEVEDTLRGILGLTFSVIEVMEETFREMYGLNINELFRDTKRLIGFQIEESIIFKPNK